MPPKVYNEQCCTASPTIPLAGIAENCLCSARRITSIVDAIRANLYGESDKQAETKPVQSTSMEMQLNDLENMFSIIESKLENANNRLA